MSLLASYLQKKQFQYILCCGSTILLFMIVLRMANFNTSYVVVQQSFEQEQKSNLLFQYILCCGSTKRNKNTSYENYKFQYILCCGSTTALLSIS